MPLDDPKTYEMLARGDSVGVFQFESDGMREALRKVKPTEFQDLVALVSLYRPGAMRYIPDYARGKRDPSSVRYPDERMREITEPTYGCVIYQEQLMEIAKQMAGFSPAEADDLRKAVGKKKRDLMATMQPKFMAGLEASGTERHVAKDLWSLMTAAADYSLQQVPRRLLRADRLPNRLPARQLPAEYMAALISSVMTTKDKVPSSSTAATRWASRCCRPTSTPPTTASSSAATASASGSTRSRTSATPPSARSSRRASRAATSPRCGTSASASTRARSTSARSSA